MTPDDPRTPAPPAHDTSDHETLNHDTPDHDSIETVFAGALTLDPAGRAAYLAERCADRPRLRQEVESLLAAHDRSGPLDAAIPTNDPDSEPAPSYTGITIGHFRLLDEIGRGGMGVVYRAERSDGQFTQQVAVKLIHPGLPVPPWSRPAAVPLHERASAVPLSEHADASPVREAGVLSLHERASAVPLSEHAEASPVREHAGVLSLQERASAVPLSEHAEASPVREHAGILSPHGRAGAEALRRYRAERQILASLHHPHIVTLLDAGLTTEGQAYLVMEVVEGEPITREQGRPLGERLRLFQDVCAAVHYAHQHGVVHRDLKPANILVTHDGVVKVLDFGVAKLLDETPNDDDRTAAGAPRPLTPSYASPEQLRGQPVTTSCDIYALGVLLYELVTGGRPYDTAGLTFDQIVALVTGHDPPRPSQRHGSRRALAGDIDAIVLKAMRKDPAERYASAQALAEDLARHLAGQPIVAREPSLGYLAATLAARHKAAVISAALALVTLIVAFAISLHETRVAVAARTRADARFADVRQLANALIFKVQDEVQPLAGSTPVRKAIIAEALAYLERLSRDPAGDDGLRLDLASAYHRIGRLQGLPSSANLGDREGARQSFKKSIELLRPLASGASPRHDAALLLGRVELDLATTSYMAGAEDEASAAVREAGTLADAWIARDPSDAEARRLRGSAFFSEALSARTDALPIWQQAETQFRSLLAEQPDNLDNLRNFALVEKYIGENYGNRGDWPMAIAHHREALDLDQRRLARLAGNRTAQMDLALDLSNLARAQWQTRQLDDAAAGYRHSLALRQQLADTDPQDVFARGRLAFAHHMLGRVLLAQHDAAQAVEHARESVSIQETLTPIDPEHRFLLGQYLNALGWAQQEAGQASAACQSWRQSLTLLTALQTADGEAGRAAGSSNAASSNNAAGSGNASGSSNAVGSSNAAGSNKATGSNNALPDRLRREIADAKESLEHCSKANAPRPGSPRS